MAVRELTGRLERAVTGAHEMAAEPRFISFLLLGEIVLVIERLLGLAHFGDALGLFEFLLQRSIDLKAFDGALLTYGGVLRRLHRGKLDEHVTSHVA